ncbi:hypothetical protein IWX90DRAFT_221177 [Phyllosticta citrichinensis]|uniref:Uncharacterized protein n=1 Tax=Phyllosticta citrichinensis TaxID=1130410 RepID=A0ABR1XTT4_9PEZI
MDIVVQSCVNGHGRRREVNVNGGGQEGQSEGSPTVGQAVQAPGPHPQQGMSATAAGSEELAGTTITIITQSSRWREQGEVREALGRTTRTAWATRLECATDSDRRHGTARQTSHRAACFLLSRLVEAVVVGGERDGDGLGATLALEDRGGVECRYSTDRGAESGEGVEWSTWSLLAEPPIDERRAPDTDTRTQQVNRCNDTSRGKDPPYSCLLCLSASTGRPLEIERACRRRQLRPCMPRRPSVCLSVCQVSLHPSGRPVDE